MTNSIIRSHPRSYFVRFRLNSDRSRALLSPNPFRQKRLDKVIGLEARWEDVPVKVLQLIVVGDNEIIAELVDIKPYLKERTKA